MLIRKGQLLHPPLVVTIKRDVPRRAFFCSSFVVKFMVIGSKIADMFRFLAFLPFPSSELTDVAERAMHVLPRATTRVCPHL